MSGAGPPGSSGTSSRWDPMVNGALVALGVVAVVDNVVSHWILGLHRAVPGPHAGAVETGLVALGVTMTVVGVVRERRARRPRRAGGGGQRTA